MPQLAQRIRAKYPGAYDDIDDATLEKQVLAKHPEYADLAQPEPQKPAPKLSMVDMALTDNPAMPRSCEGQAVLRLAKSNPGQAGALLAGAAPLRLLAACCLSPQRWVLKRLLGQVERAQAISSSLPRHSRPQTSCGC
jgi:hypothetical protein